MIREALESASKGYGDRCDPHNRRICEEMQAAITEVEPIMRLDLRASSIIKVDISARVNNPMNIDVHVQDDEGVCVSLGDQWVHLTYECARILADTISCLPGIQALRIDELRRIQEKT